MVGLGKGQGKETKPVPTARLRKNETADLRMTQRAARRHGAARPRGGQVCHVTRRTATGGREEREAGVRTRVASSAALSEVGPSESEAVRGRPAPRAVTDSRVTLAA